MNAGQPHSLASRLREGVVTIHAKANIDESKDHDEKHQQYDRRFGEYYSTARDCSKRIGCSAISTSESHTSPPCSPS